MSRALSGVALIGLALFLAYLWARGSLNELTDFVSAKVQGQARPPRPRLLGGSEAPVA